MRVAHGDRNASHLARRQLDGELIADLGFAHGDLELVLRIAAGQKITDLQTSAGTDYDFLFALLGAKIGSHATSTIARNFRFRSIGIEQASLYVGIRRGKQPFDTVSAYPLMPLADTPAESGQVGWGMGSVNDKEIVSASVRFDERDSAGRRTHSACTGPSEVALSKTGDFFRPCRT